MTATNTSAPHAIDSQIVGELHTYVRHNMQIWVQWFTVYITVNYVSLGWFAGKIAETGTLKDKRPLLYVAILFILQGILGIWASLAWRNWFKTTEKTLSLAYGSPTAKVDVSCFPQRIYAFAILLGVLALIVIIGIWLAMAVGPWHG